MTFLLTGVAETAEQATATARNLVAMLDTDRQKIPAIGHAAPSALRAHGSGGGVAFIRTIWSCLIVAVSTAGLASRKDRSRRVAYGDHKVDPVKKPRDAG